MHLTTLSLHLNRYNFVVDKSDFVDALSNISSSVFVVGSLFEGKIHGCTISSLVSIDVSPDNQLVSFFLKMNSDFGSKLEIGRTVSFNLLSTEQKNMAVRYAGPRNPEAIELQDVWSVEERGPILHNAVFSLIGEVSQIQAFSTTKQYLCRIFRVITNDEMNCLLYSKRRYGYFSEDDECVNLIGSKIE